ncbi:energy transducer TonB [Mucilaginibacter sp. HMF5004]|uniref:energy transducer TonB n=1 Tax=Mucilaginibacter rivuli TaxID=2857527 RepID=UPI001C5F9A9B|nr:energy transducer TonB [Mucilaginibacter rivuli]MBW4890734.1 energy transducer TonB [Mucilaginibacter rivuli]
MLFNIRAYSFLISFAIGVIFGGLHTAFAQQSDSKPLTDTNKVFIAIEVEPEPSIGFPAFYTFLANNLRYPPEDRRDNIQGRVFVQFIVEPNGGLDNYKIIRSPSNTLAEEALRVIKMSRYWHVGIQNGKPVPFRYTLPITFKLDYLSGLKKEFSDLDNYLRANLKYPKNTPVGIELAEISINDGYLSKDITLIGTVNGLRGAVRNALKNYKNKLDVPSGKYLIAFHFCTHQQTPDEKDSIKLRNYDYFLGDIYVVDDK